MPTFPESRPVELEDRENIEALFTAMQPEVSEFNFTNLYMFRHVHDYRLSLLNGNLLIQAKSYSKVPYFFPPVGDSMVPQTLSAMMGNMRGRGEAPLVCIAWKGFIDRHIAGSGEYVFEADHDSADYVYDTMELVELSGRKFHDKKNLKNRFVKTYGGRFEYRRLTTELVTEAMELTGEWCRDKCTADSPSTFGETEATMCALESLDRLSTKGGVVLVDGKVQALSLGEELNREMVVVHVEKANAEFQGLYQYMSSEFLAREFSGYKFVNREQDLGEPNLRKSKLSYNPIRMVEKYTIRPK